VIFTAVAGNAVPVRVTAPGLHLSIAKHNPAEVHLSIAKRCSDEAGHLKERFGNLLTIPNNSMPSSS
jgi:hypothetical protein